MSLFVNHITPIKLGDAVRIGILTWKEKQIEPGVSAHSVIVLRAMDMFFLMIFSFIGLTAFSRTFTVRYSLGLVIFFGIIGVIGVVLIKKYRPSFLKKHFHLLKEGLTHKNAFFIILFVAVSWVLEGVVVWGVTASLHNSLPFYKAIWVNSITVGGQIFQITPGGISTYESVMTAALTSFQYPIETGYLVALISHSYKFLFSYLVGLLIIIHSPIRKVKLLKEILLRGRQK
ncbi:hypothetical protein AM1BK_21510 [Neobacillus kokaensis]|uniref:Phosphatidylglycerol lysyltransferase n=1 Tax=Neobacillus kokaensis TaxID=2759023 RepID=A0ABQ3N3P5_9BACI|nr:hypothetical protein AM1BK_21510 [Neobacillus kokaensis]